MKRILEKTPKLQYHAKGIFFNYNIQYSSYYNEHTKSMNEYEDMNFISIQFNPFLFDKQDIYYDGHTAKSITILGVSFSKGYTYAWKNLGN